MKKVVLLIGLMLIIVSGAYAQKKKVRKNPGPGQGGNEIVEQILNTGTIILNPAVELDMSYVSQPQFTFQTLDDYENGITLNDICNVKVKATAAWTLTVHANAGSFTHTGTGNTMPCSILKVKGSSSSAFQTITTTPVSLATGTKGNTIHAGNFFSLSYQANPGYNYNGATYTINLMYTLTAQ